MRQLSFPLQAVFLATTFLLAGILGAYVIYVLLIFTILLALSQAAQFKNLWITGEKASLLLLIAFVLFLLGFALSVLHISDLIFSLNYSPLILFAPLAAFLGRGANRGNTQTLAWLSFAGLLLMLAAATIQVLALDIPRAEGFEIDPIAMGHTAVMLGFFAVIGFPGAKGWVRYLLLLAPVLGVVGALLTGSRGPVLAAVPLALIALIFLTRRPFASILITLLTGVIMAILLSIFWPSAFSRLETLYRMGVSLVTQGAIEERSTALRLEMYYGAFKAFLDSPWFGHGWENKFSALAPYFPADWDGFKGHHHLHADLADTAVASGSIGLVAYVLIILAPVIGAHYSNRDSQYRSRIYLAWMLSVGYFFFGLTYLLFGYEYHTTLYAILAAAIIGFCRDEVPRLQGQSRAGISGTS